jgi:Ca2+-binding RTX toxin-like protein
MLATHHQSVLAYEAKYDPLTAASIKGVETIGTIVSELQPAITAVLEKFDLPAKRHVEEILAADTGIADISGDGTGYDTSKNDDDLLLGDRAANTLSGGNGKDILIGLKGKDILSGGSGADLFVFTTAIDSPASGGIDLVKDFQMGDQLVLRSAVELQLLEDRDADFTGAEGEIRWFWDGGKTMVEADYDGDRNADLAFAITGKVSLIEGDFLL